MIEIKPVKKIHAQISIPGSKYIANRVLIISALADGTSVLNNMPDNEDIRASIEALKQLGTDIKKEGSMMIVKGGTLTKTDLPIDVKESGTLLRFITGLASLVKGETKITGSKRIKKRPIGDLIKSLEELGVLASSNRGCPPVSITGSTLKGGITRINGKVSSQFISALLLISPYAKRDVEILVEGELVSKDYVDMTIETMWEFNVCVERLGYKKFKIKAGQRYLPREFVVTGDWTTANYFFAAAAICNGSIRVNGLNTKRNRGDARFLDALVEMGCMSRMNTNWAELIGLRGLSGIEIDMSTMPDSVQTLAAVASLADGTTKITNIAHLKNKESNRIKDTVNELKKIGVLASSTEDTITIKGSKMKQAELDSHNDHRMAMSLALIGLKTPGIRIANPECVNKSFPGFWEKMKEIGVETKNV